MSFILDALRKSENSRLRQDHPAVFSPRISAPRQRLPVWSVVLIALLVVNLLIVVFLWLRQTSTDAALSTQPTASSAPDIPSSIREPVALVPPASIVEPATVSTPAMTEMSKIKSLVTRDDLLARGTPLPLADLNMHVYDANPSLRFVLLNGQRLQEGESSREGLLVERITPEGVVLRYDGSTFAVNLQ